MFLTCHTGNVLRSYRDDSVQRSSSRKVSDLHPRVPRGGIILQDLKERVICCSAHVQYVSYILTLKRNTEITNLTSVGPPIIPPPGQSQPPPHDQGSSSIKSSRERRQRCPGLSSGKKGEHRSEVDRAVVSSSNNKSLHDVEYRDCSIVSVLPWSWVGGNTHGLRGYPEAVEALRQGNCHWRTLVFGTCFSKEIFRYVYIQYTRPERC